MRFYDTVEYIQSNGGRNHSITNDERCRNRVKTFTSNGNQQAVTTDPMNRRSKSVTKAQKYDNNPTLKFNSNYYLNENEQLIVSTISNSANVLFKSNSITSDKSTRRNNAFLENSNDIDDDNVILDNYKPIEFNLTSEFNNNNSEQKYELMNSNECIVQNRTPTKVALKKKIDKCKSEELMKNEISSSPSDSMSNLDDSLMDEDGKSDLEILFH